MADLPLRLALFNLLPILFSAIALALIARLVAQVDRDQRWLAWIGGGLVILGGLSKAIWKLVVATTGQDLTWLASALFPLLGPGFVLLAGGLWVALRHRDGKDRGRRYLWLIALVAILLAFAVAAWRTWASDIPRGWFLPLMILTTLGNLGLCVLLIHAAARRRLWGAVALVVVNLAVIFVLPPIAMIEPKPLALHWLEQGLTALGTASFALAAYLLWRALSEERFSAVAGAARTHALQPTGQPEQTTS